MIEERKCVKCKEVINPLRLKALPTAKTCVECSTTGAKRGMPVMFGDKDNTWVDVVLMEPDEFERLEKAKKKKVSFDKLEDSEMNDDGDDNISEWDNTLLDGLEDM
jgi:predicted RNA-binding protein YlxR (DUF448 family)